MMRPMDRRIAVRGIALIDGKILCVQLKPYNEHIVEGAWCLPGGKLDPGEALVPGCEREMFEETGIPAKVGNLLYIQQFHHGGREHLEFFFHITNAEDYLHVDLSKTTHGMEEIAAIDFIDPKTTHPLPVFLSTEDITAKVATNGPPTIFSFVG